MILRQQKFKMNIGVFILKSFSEHPSAPLRLSEYEGSSTVVEHRTTESESIHSITMSVIPGTISYEDLQVTLK
jgi:hypothetical protein